MNKEETNDTIYKKIFWFLPIGLIIFFIDVCLNSYVYSKMKWFMDSKWISLPKLFMIFAIIGFIINIIFCIIFTYIKCGGELSDYFCRIKDNKGDKYLDNFYKFFDDISNIYGNDGNYLIYNIYIILPDIIFNSLFVYFFFLILKNLTPEFFYFLFSVVEIFDSLIDIFERKAVNDYYFAKEGDDYIIPLTKFILLIIGNFLAFIGFLVYLEIIELNFCGFNYNLRRKIIDRSIEDIEDSIERINNDDQNELLFEEETQN